MARGRLEFCALGHCLLSSSFSGEEDFWEMVGEEPCAWPYLYGAADSRDLGDFCNHGYGAAYRVSGQSGRISQGGDSGRNHAAPPLSQRVLGTFDSVCYFCDAPACKAVLEMEGSLVCDIDSAGHLLVVGQRDYFGKQ